MQIDLENYQYLEGSALKEQVGGDHYSKLAIQPVEYINANHLTYLQGNVIKYVTRYKDKDGVHDLYKAIHSIKILIAMEEADNE
jgi:hypothetical protein